jgi:DNA-binding MarR family transcriptional regulator
MNTKDETIVKEFVGSIRRLLRAVYLDSQRISKQYGLTAPQSGVLRSLFNNGSMSSAALSRLTYVTPSNITGIIDRLESKGLVERIRVKGDRRIAMITLTHKGEALSKTLPDPIEERFVSQVADMETAHIQILSKVMNQLVDQIENREPLGNLVNSKFDLSSGA